MPETSIRELKICASEIVRRVRVRKIRYVITYRGRPVAILGPVEETPAPYAVIPDASAWHRLGRLGEKIRKGWRAAKTRSDLLDEFRREATMGPFSVGASAFLNACNPYEVGHEDHER